MDELLCRYLWEYLALRGYTLLYNTRVQLIGPTEWSRLAIKSPSIIIKSLAKIGMTPLRDIPVFDGAGNLVQSLATLTKERLERSRGEYPTNSISKSSSPCILDHFTSPIIPIERPKRRYIFYEPHGSWMMQIEALHKALVFSNQLDCTLILPPFINPSNTTESIPLNFLFTFNSSFASTSPYESFPFSHFTLHRNTLFKSWTLRYDVMMNLGSPLLRDRGISIGEQAIIPVLWGKDTEMKAAYTNCDDVVLNFRHFNNVISLFDDEIARQNLKTLQNSWNLSTPLATFISNMTSFVWPGLVCAVHSRGNGKIPCGMDIYNSTEHGLLYYRSCQAGPARLADYAVEAGAKRMSSVDSVYLLSEAPLDNQTIPENTQTGIPIYTVGKLVIEIIKRPELGIPPGMAPEIANMLERELCRVAPLFLNNIYSPLGSLISKYRLEHERPVQILGQLDHP